MTLPKSMLLFAYAIVALSAATSAALPLIEGGTGGTDRAVSSGAAESIEKVSWQQFVAAVTPSGTPGKVTYETWASDQDIFVSNPCRSDGPTPGCNIPAWPSATVATDGKLLHRSLLGLSHMGLGSVPHLLAVQIISPAQGCSSPPGLKPGHAAAGSGFPPSGCVGEEVRRDRASFDYMVRNGLWSRSGLTSFYNAKTTVSFPTDALEVKADWIPVSTLSTWIGRPESFVTANFYTAVASASEGGTKTIYAMTSMHISLKAAGFPDWIWTTFENAYTPGRCDQTGCSDDFGAGVASVPANTTAWQQYGACPKTAALGAMMSAAGVAPVFANYCMTGTQTTFGTKGSPTLLGSPIVEPLNADVPLSTSSCISCHAGASFNGTTTGRVGSPVGPNAPRPGYATYDFMWGVLFAQ